MIDTIRQKIDDRAASLPRETWDRYMLLRQFSRELVEAGATSISSDIRRMGKLFDCERFANLILYQYVDIKVCGHCDNTERYGIDTLLQTGHRTAALSLLR